MNQHHPRDGLVHVLRPARSPIAALLYYDCLDRCRNPRCGSQVMIRCLPLQRWDRESSYRFFRLTPMTADQGMSLVWLSSSTCNPYSCTVSLPVLKMMVPCARSMPTSTYSSSVALPGWVLTRTVMGLPPPQIGFI